MQTFEPSRSRSERLALGIFALLAAMAMFWVAHSVAVGIFLGMLTAFMFEPLYAWLIGRMHRPAVARTICLIAATLGIVLIVAGILYLLIDRGIVIVHNVIEALQPGGSARPAVEDMSNRLAPLGINLTVIVDKLREAAASVASFAATVAATIAARTFSLLMMLFFTLLTMHFVLARWSGLTRVFESVLPLSPAHTRALIAEFHEVGRVTLLGSVVTGIAQGVLAGLVYWVCGVPEPAFFGAATAVASLIPGVGTLLIWVPAGIYMIATGHVIRGSLEILIAALLVVGFCDYILRPRLVGGESMPALLTFAAIFGGVEAFGLVGLLLGPLVMAVALALLRIYARDSDQALRRSAS